MDVHKKTSPKTAARVRRKERVRKKIRGTTDRPRLAVFRSLKYIYAQVIDDVKGVTLAAASSAEKTFPKGKSTSNIDAAKTVGKMVAERAKTKSVEVVSFDRAGYLYHGRVKAVAEAAREAGLKF